jgi:hypothetical protein
MAVPAGPVNVLRAAHRAPIHVAVIRAMVVCPLTRRPRSLTDCAACPLCQGMLIGPDPCMLCAAPARSAGRRHRGHAHWSSRRTGPTNLADEIAEVNCAVVP